MTNLIIVILLLAIGGVLLYLAYTQIMNNNKYRFLPEVSIDYIDKNDNKLSIAKKIIISDELDNKGRSKVYIELSPYGDTTFNDLIINVPMGTFYCGKIAYLDNAPEDLDLDNTPLDRAFIPNTKTKKNIEYEIFNKRALIPPVKYNNRKNNYQDRIEEYIDYNILTDKESDSKGKKNKKPNKKKVSDKERQKINDNLSKTTRDELFEVLTDLTLSGCFPPKNSIDRDYYNKYKHLYKINQRNLENENSLDVYRKLQ